tara:strand:+ start:335 stop:565 length:231 start_codon:yes stop_codon:yes gene_type:complete
MIGNGKKSRRRNKPNPCDALWAERKALYLEKPGGAQEWETEKDELYCDGTKIIIRKSDDADVPFTNKQMEEYLKEK